MIRYHNSGFTTWDLADIYGPAESFIGKFRKSLEKLKGKDELKNSQVLTKFVPNPGPMSKSFVEHYINKSLEKMNTSCLDLLQFHWWDYNDPSYIDGLTHLSNLQDAGKIKHIDLTNFDTQRLEIISDQDLKIISNQVQYSILDSRPEKLMVPFCKQNDIQILSYGTLLEDFYLKNTLVRLNPQRGVWILQV